MITVDVQPNYVRATIKGKIFQMALSSEVRCTDATSKRSMVTGHLLITMPKLCWTTPMQFQPSSSKSHKHLTASKDRGDLNGAVAVDYRHIVADAKRNNDVDDVPPLV